MRLEYCDDSEGAIAILMLACKWTDAISVATKKQRFDLLLDEVCGSQNVIVACIVVLYIGFVYASYMWYVMASDCTGSA